MAIFVHAGQWTIQKTTASSSSPASLWTGMGQGQSRGCEAEIAAERGDELAADAWRDIIAYAERLLGGGWSP